MDAKVFLQRTEVLGLCVASHANVLGLLLFDLADGKRGVTQKLKR
jgi:hypothetical protein